MPIDPKNFAPNNPEQVKELQEKINEYLKLSGSKIKQLEVTKTLDSTTKTAWKQFKNEAYTDGQISVGYLRDTLKLDDEGLKKLGIQDLEKFNRENPPSKAISAISEKLHLPVGTDYNSREFQNAVKKDKRAHWIDERLNPGALEKIDESIDSLLKSKQELENMTQGFSVLGKKDSGTGVALIQQHLHSNNIDGVYGPKTVADVKKFQQYANEQRKAEGLPPIEVDGNFGRDTYLEFKKAGFDYQQARIQLDNKLTATSQSNALYDKLEKIDEMRSNVFEIRQGMAKNVFGGDDKTTGPGSVPKIAKEPSKDSPPH